MLYLPVFAFLLNLNHHHFILLLFLYKHSHYHMTDTEQASKMKLRIMRKYKFIIQVCLFPWLLGLAYSNPISAQLNLQYVC